MLEILIIGPRYPVPPTEDEIRAVMRSCVDYGPPEDLSVREVKCTHMRVPTDDLTHGRGGILVPYPWE